MLLDTPNRQPRDVCNLGLCNVPRSQQYGVLTADIHDGGLYTHRAITPVED